MNCCPTPPTPTTTSTLKNPNPETEPTDEEEEDEFNLDYYSMREDVIVGDENKRTKSVYEELAEKEKALLLAAQFGKSLIDEKEELERQIEMLKREHQNQLEVKRLVFIITSAQ